jgi:branched-subunit amino acid aminotransferase/4-amino-4-deoxychorismate lyase
LPVTEPILYVNGAFVPLPDARVSVLDQGFLLGDGVFDVISAWQGTLFRLEDHLDRFDASLRAGRFGCPLTRSEWREVILETRVCASSSPGVWRRQSSPTRAISTPQ